MEKNIDMSKYDFILKNNEERMDYTALSFGDRKISYEELFESINKCAKILRAKGIQKGDLVGICALNTPESVYLIYALNLIGAVVVGYSPLESKEKVQNDVKLTQPKMVITTDLSYGNFKDLEKSLNFSTILYSPTMSSNDWKLKLGLGAANVLKGNVTLKSDKRLENLVKRNYDGISIGDTPYEEGALSDIMFTGGSSGVHKGVELTDRGLNSVVVGMNSIYPAEPGMIHLGNIPFGFMAFGRSILHYTLSNGMELALTLKAMPGDFYDEIVRTHSNIADGGPPHWTSLIEKSGDSYIPNSKIKKGSLSELQFACSGGEALKEGTQDVIDEALKYGGSPAKLSDGLGATETWATMITCNSYVDKKGTLGRPISTLDVKLVSPETGEAVKPGEKGILHVSGPSVMRGYFKNPEETNKVIVYDKDGKRWLNVGDVLRQIESGEYEYVGREKRNFVSGVDNIYPEEIENILSELPEIRDVVVTPISDNEVQYIPRYHISLHNSDTDIAELEEKIKALICSKLSDSNLPGSIVYYYEPLKRMANTKIDVSYYKNLDSIALEKGEIDHTEAKQLRLKKM